jgi:hypothetical protein
LNKKERKKKWMTFWKEMTSRIVRERERDKNTEEFADRKKDKEKT